MMGTVLLNREFRLPDDGWFQIAPLGEFAHASAGVSQVVDEAACRAMAAAFEADSRNANFAGLLVDFDHFSLDRAQRSEAAGWITALELRGDLTANGANCANGKCDAGLWAKIRWSDVGESAVAGGRYRFISPVWRREDCEDLGPDPVSGQDRLRPVRLLNAAVTNDPNLKGLVPLSNRAEGGAVALPADCGQPVVEYGDARAAVREAVANRRAGGEMGASAGSVLVALRRDKAARRALANAAGGDDGEVRLKWVLGEPESGRHCPSCVAGAGQVHTEADWEAADVAPGRGVFCGSDCHCSLVETDEPVSGSLDDVPAVETE